MRKERRHLHHQKARLSKSRLCLDRVLSQREVNVLLLLLESLEGRLVLDNWIYLLGILLELAQNYWMQNVP